LFLDGQDGIMGPCFWISVRGKLLKNQIPNYNTDKTTMTTTITLSEI